MVFLACGGVCLARAHAIAAERTPWGLIGLGLVLYAGGSVVYNLELSSGAEVGFPSRADTLWLALYPLCFAGMVGLVRARHVQVNASLWLDALIGGSAVAAVAAVFLLPPIFEPVVGEGWETAARLAYPLADLLLTGFAVVLWGAGRWRRDAWLALALGFALIAVSDSVYVLAQTGDGWTPGSLGDLGYAAGSIAIAVAAWRSQPRVRGVPNSRVVLPIAFTVTSFALVCYEAFAELDVLAVALIRLTLLAVVLRLGLTLWWLSRQRADLEALAASDPLTGLGNYRAFQERLAAAVAVGAEVGVIVLDLDHFKVLNDTFGHAEGDRVLQATAIGAVADGGGARLRRARRRRGVRDPRPGRRRAGGGRGRGALPRRALPAPGPRRRARLLGRRVRLPGPRDDGAAAAAGGGRRAVLGEALGPQSHPRLRPAPRGGAVAGRAAARGPGDAGDRRADRPGLPADDGGRHRPRRRL